MSLTVFGHPFSSYTWKVLIPLYANGTPFEARTVGADPDAGAFVGAAHPAGKFPVLRDGNRTVIEATAIVEYLAVHHPGESPLIPSEAADAVSARMLDRVFDNYVMGNVQRIVGAYLRNPETPNPEPIASGKEGLKRAYAWLEAWLSEHAMPPHVSLVTCAAAPSLFYSDWVEPIGPDFGKLAAFRSELLALPPVARCVEEARPYRHFFPPGAPERD